ncbi:hypothetical protein [Neobacillus vireti]|uniref:hypothetical protein n=1 Tax=Neobacillus vireti TaxID=220686 RepID=UPI003000EB9A
MNARIIGFVVAFILIYMIFVEVPTDSETWFDILGIVVGVSILWFLASYISLKRSYHKNKELL